MVMNKTSSINNNQFNNNNNNNLSNNEPNSHLITNGKNVGNPMYYGHDAQRIEQYKASFEYLQNIFRRNFHMNK